MGHSASPALYAAAFTALGVDAVYSTERVEAGALAGRLRVWGRRGGGNVTLPHKERAAALLDRATEAVRRTGACNCFWGADGGVEGDNTDVGGFVAALEGLSRPPSRGGRVLVLGAGGAARAVLAALADRGHDGPVVVHNRTAARAEELIRRFGDELPGVAADPDRPPAGPWDLVVNATRLGLGEEDPLPLPLVSSGVGQVLDLVYGPAGTPWVREARRLGIPAADGREMLVRQGGLAVRRWLGREPPLPEMRRAVEEFLAGRAD